MIPRPPRPIRGLLALALSAAAAAAAALAGPPAAVAQPAPPTVPPGTSTTSTGTCTAYASDRSFGYDCGIPGTGQTVAQILQGDPFPRCREVPLPEDLVELPPPRLPDGRPRPGRYVLEECFSNPEQVSRLGVGRSATTEEAVWRDEGVPLLRLTTRQQLIWDIFGSSYYANVWARTGPTTAPRVNATTWFWVVDRDVAFGEYGRDRANNPGALRPKPITKTYDDPTGGEIVLEAAIDRVVVNYGMPDTEGRTSQTCSIDGMPVFDTRLTLAEQSSDCTAVYPRSSASLEGDADTAGRALVSFEVYWRVDWWRTADPGQRFSLREDIGPFVRTRIVPVLEVQAINQREQS